MCWLSGRDLFERFGGKVPVGLAMNAVGAHPIESWLGPDQLEACGIQTFNHGARDVVSSFRGKLFGPSEYHFFSCLKGKLFGLSLVPVFFFFCSALFPWSRSS